MHRKRTTLYNVIFPIWFLWILPMCWVFILPANLLIDALVIVLTLKFLHCKDILATLGFVIWRVWLIGFVADLIGAVLIFLPLLPAQVAWLHDIQSALTRNPFTHPLALAWILACIAVSGTAIYCAARKFTLRRAQLPADICRSLALSLAVFTPPYTLLIPPVWV